MEPDTETEMLLLGSCIFMAQRIEFGLYGIAAHITHLPEAQKDRRLRELDPEKFLRGDPQQLKMTLGQLVEFLGDKLFIRTADLQKYVDDRNLIVHNYYRVFRPGIRGAVYRADGVEFLTDFLSRSDYWYRVLRGLTHQILLAFAERDNRREEVVTTAEDQLYLDLWHTHANAYRAERGAAAP